MIDPRTAADIEKKIVELAGCYDTGWHYDPEDPDIGVALAKIFATQMEENIGLENDVLNRYHTEFINLLDISLLPAKPASSVVVANLIDDALSGAFLEKGTKLFSDADEPVIFETDNGVYVTGARISAAYMTDFEDGTLVPLLGKFQPPEIPGELGNPQEESTALEDEADVEEEGSGEGDKDKEKEKPVGDHSGDFPFLKRIVPDSGDDEEDTLDRAPTLRPFTLFGEHDGIERNVLLMYHPTVFDVENESIYFSFSDAEKLVQDINEGRVQFGYVSAAGITAVDSVEALDDGKTFVVKKSEECSRIHIGEKEYSVFLLIAKGPVESARKAGKITLSSSGAPTPAESVSDGQTDFEPSAFSPFSDTLSLYAECFIGLNSYFSKAGSNITMAFDVSFEEHRITMTPEQLDESLKVIKKKPRIISKEVSADSHAEEVALEYFNGTGWKKLPLSGEIRTLFALEKPGRVELRFVCPSDWQDTSAGAFTGKILRLQLLKADNCYLRPCVHHYPVMKNLTIAYEYPQDYTIPSLLEVIAGTKKYDITPKMKNPKGFVTFRQSEYHDDALYLCFSKALEEGPISLLFELEDASRFEELKCRFEYMTSDGFKVLKVSDQTQDFTRSGVVRFIPPPDMFNTTLEGQKGYWIRIVRGKRQDENESIFDLPKIRNIYLNAVTVSNIETLGVMDLYVNTMEPNMRFGLSATNILDAEVWVNEITSFSRDEMKRRLMEDPDNNYAEFDMMGNFTAFYTKWEEVTHFSEASHPRVYILDRLRNQLLFGDGVETYFPRVMDDTAIRVRIRRSGGESGNVDVGTIDTSMSYLMYIGDLYNPVRAYGGSNIENIDEALQRGANILSSGGRLVSLEDYKRGILSYSDTIDQVRGVTGVAMDGSETESDIWFVLLMKEFADGSFAFHQIVGGLKKYLLAHSEVTVTEERLHIVEPIFVAVSVEVWVSVIDMDDSFELQPLMNAVMEEYLNPTGLAYGRGWRIGTLPKKSQLLMRLNILKSRAMVKRSMITVSYRDSKGLHEADLDDVEVTPFMVPVSGQHKVHVMY